MNSDFFKYNSSGQSDFQASEFTRILDMLRVSIDIVEPLVQSRL